MLSPEVDGERARSWEHPNRAELDQRLNAERGKLFRAMGIVSVVREVLHNSESKPDKVMRNAATNSWCALEAAYEVMNEVAGAIESSEILGRATFEFAVHRA